MDYDAMARAPQFAAYLGTLARTTEVDGWPRAERSRPAHPTPTMPTPSPSHRARNERRSIRNINKSFGVVGSGAWGEKMAAIGGVTLTRRD
ncbi:MAG: hypothetical protein IPN47_23635 [Gemmatimonadetes bacterium]|nr:hypothetical protein [Gemmatimonadota bacterium]